MKVGPVSNVSLAELTRLRATRPDAIAEAAQRRERRELFGEDQRMVIVAADHPARGALSVGGDPMAMANRFELLERLCIALSRPGVSGVLGTADILEDLLLLGALEKKVVVGSMNRGGLAGAAFELDDRFTGHRAKDIQRLRFDAGKLLLRIDLDDPGSLNTLDGAARAINELAKRKLVALVEPFVSQRFGGELHNDVSPEAVTRSITIASGLGGSSAYTWLKVPVVDDIDQVERVLQATALPTMLLGGEISADNDATYRRWGRALRSPTVRGIVAGRTLLYPSDGDVAQAVDTAVSLL